MERHDVPAGENVLLTTKAPEFFGMETATPQPIDIIVGTHVPMLVPDVIYDEAKAKDYLNMQFDITHYGQHFSDQLGHYRSLYFLTQNEYDTINHLPCIPHFISEGTLLYRFLCIPFDETDPDLLQRLLDRFGEEGVVVITTMAMFMIGNNYFNDILRVQSEFLTPASETN